jgi:ribonuclease P protein component
MAEILVLKKRKDFVRVAKGVSKVTKTAILQAAPSLSKNIVAPKIGYTTTKKIGKANVRNRTRRRLRAVIHELLPIYGLNNVEYVLIGRHNTHYCPYKDLRSDIKWAIKKINLLLASENNTNHQEKISDNQNENIIDLPR